MNSLRSALDISGLLKSNTLRSSMVWDPLEAR
jgi:hypothetical protein